MERCLNELEVRPKDAGLIGDIFRSVHTIKGTTGSRTRECAPDAAT